jgi:hypothetical protein
MYTLTSSYGATGEGITVMVLYTPGHGPADPKTNAVEHFKEVFDPFYAIGLEIYDGITFDIPYIELLISDKTKALLSEPNGNKVYFSQIHINYS